MTGTGPLSLPSSDRLKDVAAINARSLPASTQPEAEIEYIDISNVDYFGVVDRESAPRLRFEDAPSRARRRIAPGATIVSSVRPALQAVAHFADANDDLICSTGFNTVEPHAHRLLPRFAYYVLISDHARQHFEACSTGVGYPAVGDKWFGALPVPVPPLEEQARIATFLDQACAVIDRVSLRKQGQITALQHYWRSVLQRLVTRGVTADPRLEATTSTWLPALPKGWAPVALKRCAEIRGGLTLGKSYEGELVERPYLRVANVQDGFLDLADVSTIELPEAAASRVTLREGDVLMNEGGDLDKLGRGCLWKGEIEGCLHQNHVFAIRCDPHRLNPQFLAYVSASAYGRAYFEATGKQTTNLAATNATKVGLFPVPLAPRTMQDTIVSHLSEREQEFNALRDILSQQRNSLRHYRASLIHECVTGRRSVTDEDLNRVRDHAQHSSA